MEYLGSKGYDIEGSTYYKNFRRSLSGAFSTSLKQIKVKGAASKEVSEERKREKEGIRKAREKELAKKKEEGGEV